MRRKVHGSDDGQRANGPEGRAADEEATGTNEPPRPDQPAEPAMEESHEAAHKRGGRHTRELEERIDTLQKRVEEEHTLLLRTLADFQNFRRRNEEQLRERLQFANQEFVQSLLPILDNFERALQAADQSRNYEALMGGVALTMRQLQDLLAKHGVEPIEAVGQQFDPNVHEAVLRVDDSQHPDNTVVEEMQRGYRMHQRVLRPSMVKVARNE